MKIRAGSIGELYPLFQTEDGGSSPTPALHFYFTRCNFSDIRDIFQNFHYKKEHMGGGISFCFAIASGGTYFGGAVIGKPRHNNYGENTLDIRRLACIDNAPKNTESFFLGKIVWWLKENTDCKKIISYSDLSHGHSGTIYKAANFTNIGQTSPSKQISWRGKLYHMRSLTIERPYSYELREAVKSGDAVITNGLPKLIWEYKINRR